MGGTNVFVNVTTHNVGWTFNDSRASSTYIRNSIVSESGDFTFQDQSVGAIKIIMNDSLIDNLQTQTNLSPVGIPLTITADAETLDIDDGNDPAFEDAAGLDFLIQESSPAVNAGDNAWISDTYQSAILGLPVSEQGDLATSPRLSKTIDMGAYEFQTVRRGIVLYIK